MDEVLQNLLNSAHPEILSEKPRRYKRTVLVLSVVLIGVHVLGASFEKLQLLGVGLPYVAGNRVAACAVLWLANIYSAIMLWNYGKRDWQTWVENLIGRWPMDREQKKFLFPELDMYWGKLPKLSTTRTIRLESFDYLFVEWDGFSSDKFGQILTCYATTMPKIPKHDPIPSKTPIFQVPHIVVTAVKRQVKHFKKFEVLPAVIVIILACVGLPWDITNSPAIFH